MLIKNEKQQAAHAYMLSYCSQLLTNHGVKNILSNSALLGAYRDGDMIDHCPGAVLIVFYDNIKPKENRIINLLQKKGFKLTRHFKRKRNYKIRIDNNYGNNIEIVGHYKNGDNYIRRAEKKIKTIPCHFFDGKLSKIELRGFEYTAPTDIEKYLEWLYKDWRKIIKKQTSPSVYKSENYMVI